MPDSIISGLDAYPVFSASDLVPVVDVSVTSGTNAGAGGNPTRPTMAQLGILGPTTAWTAVTFANSWVDFGSGYQACQYRSIGTSDVEVRGVMASGTLNGVVASFTLPAGFRPASHVIFDTVSNGLFGYFTVKSDGTLITGAGSNVWFSVQCRFSTL